MPWVVSIPQWDETIQFSSDKLSRGEALTGCNWFLCLLCLQHSFHFAPCLRTMSFDWWNNVRKWQEAGGQYLFSIKLATFKNAPWKISRWPKEYEMYNGPAHDGTRLDWIISSFLTNPRLIFTCSCQGTSPFRKTLVCDDIFNFLNLSLFSFYQTFL